MTSSTRFTTALHVVLNDVPDSTGKLHSLPVKVHFGSKSKNVGLYHGDYAADLPDLVNDPYYKLAYRFDTPEEEPFLAMRLFQLGMKEWAAKEDGIEIRNKMRTWNFVYDKIDGDNKTFLNQENAKIDGVRIFGRDIVVMKATNPVGVDSTEIFVKFPVTSGEFTLNRPGVLFDHVTAAPYDEDKTKPDTPLWLEHANNWMDNNLVVRLISRPGFIIEQGFTGVTSENACGGVDSFLGLVGNTLDTKRGSSGGMVIAPNVGEYLPDRTGDYVTQRLVTVGVNHGFKTPNGGVGPEWGDPESIKIDKSNRVFDGYENWFTGIADPKIPSRETPGEPIRNGAPNGCTEAQAGNSDCIPCTRWNSAGKCIEITTGPSTPVPTSGGTPAHFRDIPGDEKNYEGSGERSVRCAFDEFGRSKTIRHINQEEEYPGMMVGIAGASKGLFGNEDFVSDLYAICAPVGRVSYTENWRFLNLKGSFLPWQISNIHGRRAWGPLHIQANESYTINNNKPKKGHKYRPLPMKFCPPNYYVNGVRWRDDADGVYGITGLRCHNFSNSHSSEATGGEEIWVSLDASEEGVEGFQMFGEEYTLDQRIGNPNIGSNTGAGVRQSYECNGGFVSGFDMSHNGGGELEYFYPTCTYFEL